jgi:CheY-like chemotaxis protein
VSTACGAAGFDPPSRSAASGHGMLRVLVVDDHQDGAESLAMGLRLEGHDVQVAHDGETALAACRRHEPQMVLLDLALAGGMDGYEVARRLRRIPPLARACVVAVTGLGTSEDRRRAHEAGFDFYLLKPVDPRELHELARAVGDA